MKLSKKLLLGAIASSLGGLLFGFDTAVISGAEQGLKQYFNLSPFAHGFTNSIALIGTVFGAVLAFLPAQAFGRKKSLMAIGFLYAVSALGCALTGVWEWFLLFRFLGGLGVGASSVIGPMYISEISPSAYRGRLVGLFQFNIVLGILLAFVSNYFLNQHIAIDSWRWMLGVEVLPAILFLGLTFGIPRSPRWLIANNMPHEGLKVLQQLGDDDPKSTLSSINQSLEGKLEKENLFQAKYLKPIMLVFLMATFNQFSGINAIMYYAPRIFEMSGLATDTALIQAATVGLINMVFTLLAMSLIDKIGRKKLMVIGSVGMVLSLIVTAYLFYFEGSGRIGVIIPLLVFIASFAFSQGAVIWVFISEVFPTKVRAPGQSFGTFIHWFWAAIMTWTFPVVAVMPQGGTIAFSFFAFAMILQFGFVVKYLPETKGRGLEEVIS